MRSVKLGGLIYSRIAAVVRKEFAHILADRQTLGLLLLIPAFELLLFGYAINTVVDHVPLVVFDGTNDSESRGLLKSLLDSAYFDLRATATSYDDAVAAINAGRVKAALIIPANFGS